MAGFAIPTAGAVAGVVCLVVEPTVMAGFAVAGPVVECSAAIPSTVIAAIAPAPIAAETARILVLRRAL
ncbi:hypothetical protein A5752_13395 [Mycobacterium sp. 852002-51961_SCH5331710]|nr:hypothetical protein A5752_13395 [Mycobacterium sp. 852002-51961_SCH5331710]